MTERRNYTAYYRVSTFRQSQSGLGLDAQRAAVRAHMGADWPPVAEFVEVESGKRADRPRLTEALAYCQRRGCRLIIAKLDRLARNVHFVSGLMRSGVEFLACDVPHANNLTIHILAAVAEEEARLISQRTKAALAEWKVRYPDRRLGRPTGWKGVQTGAGAAARVKLADEFANRVGPAIRGMRAEGMSLRQIAASLTELGVKTASGGDWAASTVRGVLVRLG